MSKRKEHVFQFTASQIASAATAESAYHADRAVWWDREYDKAAVEAKEKGVEIRHYAVTGGKRAQVVVDTSVQFRLEEAERKRYDHQQKADRFAIEAATYGSQASGLAFQLDSDDVMYFRLAGGTREEDHPTPSV